MKKTLLVQYLCIGFIMFSLATNITGTSIAVTESQDEWKNFSISSYKDSVRIFKSNDTYSRQIFVKLNITNLSYGELFFSYQKGDTIPSKTFDRPGLYEFNVTTPSARLRTGAENTSIIGSYNLIIGKKVSESPWATINLAILLGLYSLLFFTNLGLHPLISVMITLAIFIEAFLISLVIVLMSYKSWKEKKTNSRLIIFGVELAVFLLITGFLLLPIRFSFF